MHMTQLPWASIPVIGLYLTGSPCSDRPAPVRMAASASLQVGECGSAEFANVLNVRPGEGIEKAADRMPAVSMAAYSEY